MTRLMLALVMLAVVGHLGCTSSGDVAASGGAREPEAHGLSADPELLRGRLVIPWERGLRRFVGQLYVVNKKTLALSKIGDVSGGVEIIVSRDGGHVLVDEGHDSRLSGQRFLARETTVVYRWDGQMLRHVPQALDFLPDSLEGRLLDIDIVNQRALLWDGDSVTVYDRATDSKIKLDLADKTVVYLGQFLIGRGVALTVQGDTREFHPGEYFDDCWRFEPEIVENGSRLECSVPFESKGESDVLFGLETIQLKGNRVVAMRNSSKVAESSSAGTFAFAGVVPTSGTSGILVRRNAEDSTRALLTPFTLGSRSISFGDSVTPAPNVKFDYELR